METPIKYVSPIFEKFCSLNDQRTKIRGVRKDKERKHRNHKLKRLDREFIEQLQTLKEVNKHMITSTKKKFHRNNSTRG